MNAGFAKGEGRSALISCFWKEQGVVKRSLQNVRIWRWERPLGSRDREMASSTVLRNFVEDEGGRALLISSERWTLCCE